MKRITMLLIVGAATAPALAIENQAVARGCSPIEVTAPGLRKQPADLGFDTRKVLDLKFETSLLAPVYGDHVLQFKVFTPSGFLYQELAAPFTWQRPGRPKGKQDAQAVAVSYPKGLQVQQLGEAAGRLGKLRREVSVQLPVAGTSITMSTLYGRWSVQAFLDGKPRPCSPVRRFTIHAK